MSTKARRPGRHRRSLGRIVVRARKRSAPGSAAALLLCCVAGCGGTAANRPAAQPAAAPARPAPARKPAAPATAGPTPSWVQPEAGQSAGATAGNATPGAKAGTPAAAGDKGETFVLVHDAWLGRYIWEPIVPLLQQRGHQVVTLDLPGHGDDKTPVENLSLDAYRDAVVAAIGERSSVVLVGHGLGGLVVSAVAEAIPERIGRLVYLGAYLPRSGDSLYSLMQEDTGSRILGHWRQDNPKAGSPASLAPAGIAEVMCGDCNRPQLETLTTKHRAEAIAPLTAAVTLSPERFGKVPRYYIEISSDNFISPAMQRRMNERVPVKQRLRMESSHCGFFANPAALVEQLEKLD